MSRVRRTKPTVMAEAMATAGIVKPAATSPTPATRAGTKEYDNFFGSYATVVRDSDHCSLTAGMDGKASGEYFLPLGFIPGPAVVLEFRGGKFCVTDATPDVRHSVEIPTPWTPVTGEGEGVPGEIWHAIGEWTALLEELGHEPSPWNLGLAQKLHAGEMPRRHLTMVMPRFRYRSGDPEVPFGVVLVPAEDDGMKVSRVYNPENIPDVPAEGEVMTIDDLVKGKGPAQKMLKTWALMESNYARRYDRYGRLRQPRRDDRRDRDDRR